MTMAALEMCGVLGPGGGGGGDDSLHSGTWEIKGLCFSGSSQNRGSRAGKAEWHPCRSISMTGSASLGQRH